MDVSKRADEAPEWLTRPGCAGERMARRDLWGTRNRPHSLGGAASQAATAPPGTPDSPCQETRACPPPPDPVLLKLIREEMGRGSSIRGLRARIKRIRQIERL